MTFKNLNMKVSKTSLREEIRHKMLPIYKGYNIRGWHVELWRLPSVEDVVGGVIDTPHSSKRDALADLLEEVLDCLNHADEVASGKPCDFNASIKIKSMSKEELKALKARVEKGLPSTTETHAYRRAKKLGLL